MTLEYAIRLERTVDGELEKYVVPKVFSDENDAKIEVERILNEQGNNPWAWTTAVLTAREVKPWNDRITFKR